MEDITSKKEKIALAVSIGEELLKNGGEVSRVEDTVRRILLHYGYTNHSAYTVSNGIFVTVDESGEYPINCMRSVPSWNMNLGKIAELNKLSRQICSDNCTVEWATKRLNCIKKMQYTATIWQVLGTGIGSAAFCFVFGGKIMDMLIALVVGFMLKSFLSLAESKQVSKFIRHIIGSFLVTIIAVLSYRLLPGIQVDKVIIGSIMLLVPGVALTTSVRDFFGGDYLSGSIHLIDALLTAVCIAAGVGVAMKGFMMIGWV
ncbi:MAG: threonine/serine exporter family protein [Lachnospiraceae bacterium]|nr:threonine/serine exporter family protein [Lachnospiraceae bacterium]